MGFDRRCERSEYDMTVDAFWDWAVACYRRAGVQQHLLLLQDTQDLVILEALFACWLASHDRQWQLDDVRAMAVSTRTWIDEVVLPLRATRMRWTGDADLSDSRQHLLALEVTAERHLAELMWSGVMNDRRPSKGVVSPVEKGTSSTLMSSNLSLLPTFFDGKCAPERLQLVALLEKGT
jgi:uncharacterized protein (TIGR02444 family)